MANNFEIKKTLVASTSHIESCPKFDVLWNCPKVSIFGPKYCKPKITKLFAVLGTVSDFKRTGTRLNREDFGKWLRTNAGVLKSDISAWLPSQLSSDVTSSPMSTSGLPMLLAINLAVGLDLNGSVLRTQELY